jgi:hypothetical protein
MPAATLAVGSATAFPFYYNFTAGYLDHHGIAAVLCLLTVLFLVFGGAGWVGNEPAANGATFPSSVVQARGWLVASALAAASGLWISASTMIPVLLSTGAGVVLATMTIPPRAASRYSFHPDLFRVWAHVGAVASLLFYLVEYFPGRLGMRLEVNHPLYAIAFWAGGNIIASLASRGSHDGAAATDRPLGRKRLYVDIMLFLLAPAAILLGGASVFRMRDPFLWTLHNRAVTEFRSFYEIARSYSPAALLAQASLLPLIGIPILAALWPRATTRRDWSLRAFLVVGCTVVAGYVGAFAAALGTAAPVPIGIVAAAFVIAGCAWMISRPPPLPPSLAVPLTLCCVPAVAGTLLGIAEIRWLGLACGLWLVVAIVGVAAMTTHEVPPKTGRRSRDFTIALTGFVLLLPLGFGFRLDYAKPDVLQIIARDFSYWLRRRTADASTVVFAGPAATNQLLWFGAFRGVPTIYWENLDGLEKAAALYAESDESGVRRKLSALGVTHVVFFSWFGDAEDLRASIVADSGDQGASEPGFLERMAAQVAAGEAVTVPSWLVPLPYTERIEGAPFPIVQVFEVVSDAPREVAALRLARYYQAMGDADAAAGALRYAENQGVTGPALATQAQLEYAEGRMSEFTATLELLRPRLDGMPPGDLDDRLEAAIAFGLAGDEAIAKRLLSGISTDETRLRRLPPKRLLILANAVERFGLEELSSKTAPLVRELGVQP